MKFSVEVSFVDVSAVIEANECRAIVLKLAVLGQKCCNHLCIASQPAARVNPPILGIQTPTDPLLPAGTEADTN